MNSWKDHTHKRILFILSIIIIVVALPFFSPGQETSTLLNLTDDSVKVQKYSVKLH